MFDENDTNNSIEEVLTDASGFYEFSNADIDRNYLVAIDLPTGFEFSPQNVSTNPTINSKVDTATGFASITIECTPNLILSSGRNTNIGIREL